MARTFYTIDTYGAPSRNYELLPFRFVALDPERELLVNEVGEYLITPRGTVNQVVKHKLETDSVLYHDLKARQFIYDRASHPLYDVLAAKYRTKKNFLVGSTKLHIFVVTLRCDHSCHYCQVSRQTTDRTRFDMSTETAERSLQVMMQSPGQHLTLEFQGGEPLLAFDTIQWTIRRAKELAAQRSKTLEIVIVTNLAYATDEILMFCRDEGVKISTSLDGPAYLHNANRPRPGNNSYELAIQGIQKAREIVGADNVAALMTTTRLSLDHPIEIIDEYVRNNFRSIFLRPISPYGFAVKTRRRTGYEMDRFIAFYKIGLTHIIDLNRRGIDFQEVYAKLLLTKILTPYATGYVDLQSPAGAGISVLVYNYDGDIYAGDEARMLAEMNDTTFRLGNVYEDTFQSVIAGSPMRSVFSAACNETLPGCAECAFQTYCGSDPVFHHATQGDLFGHRPSSGFCHKNMEILKHLFKLVASEDRELMRIFFAWIRDRGVQDIDSEAPRCD